MLASCVTNNGDIGPLYGQWILKQLTVDGTPDDIDCSDFAFSFQNNIVFITHQLGHQVYSETYGTWSVDGDKLTLNFTHTADGYSPNEVTFTPPYQLHILGQKITVMDMITLTDKQLVFGYTDSEGTTYKYTLKKLR